MVSLRYQGVANPDGMFNQRMRVSTDDDIQRWKLISKLELVFVADM